MRAADVHAKTQDHAVNIGSRSSRVIMVNQGEHPENSQISLFGTLTSLPNNHCLLPCPRLRHSSSRVLCKTPSRPVRRTQSPDPKP
ncbi:hypothetical protein K402DRAFT_122559 [Aulographum hederae CBS 113979]|uniref:Uncharacterized protein n=1 Tax=Aulographum hederae CBS 113979 TaxID=1176131 RepID=A0A6G1GVI7_9PEZI|nr:hypothetical protein K402DRAFT_122559 [Aulographum hederae CBS 113979]